jgi:hypothetical protein
MRESQKMLYSAMELLLYTLILTQIATHTLGGMAFLKHTERQKNGRHAFKTIYNIEA